MGSIKMETYSGYMENEVDLTLPFSTEGSKVVRKNYDFNTGTNKIEVTPFVINKYTTKITLPKLPQELNEDFCKFLGYWLANGCFSKNAIHFSTNNTVLGNDFLRLSLDLFGVVGHTHLEKGKVSSYHLSSAIVANYLDVDIFCGRKTARFKTIPDIVLKSSKACVKSFLVGLFDCDSYLERRTFVFNTASESVAKEVHKLLLGFGVISNLRPFDGVKGYEDHVYWDVRVSGKYVYTLYDNLFTESKVYKESIELKRVNSNFDFIPNMTEYLLKELYSLRGSFNVNKGGMYKGVDGKYVRYKIESGFYVDKRRQCTYELLYKIKDSWSVLENQQQKEAIEPIKRVIEYLLNKNVYFDKILYEQE